MPKLKVRISTEAWEKLPPVVQEFYEKTEDGYELGLDGRQVKDDDLGALRRAKDRVQQERDDLKDALKAMSNEQTELQQKLKDLDNNDARKSGDIEKLEKAWLKEKDELTEMYTKREDALKGYIEQSEISRIVDSITIQNTGNKENAALLAPHVRSRIDVEFGDDMTPAIRILDNDGSVTSLKVEDFEKEIVDNPAYAAIIVSNRASGGGAADDTKTGGGNAFPTGGNGQTGVTDLSKIHPKELVSRLAKK